MDLLEAARAALTRPEHFMYFGDLDEQVWGRAFGVHRDSDILEVSNWETISADLARRFPDDWTVERSNHFLVGWCDEGRVRVLRDSERGLTEANITDAFQAVLEWRKALADYPVADEEDYSRREFEDFSKYVEDQSRYVWREVADEDADEPDWFADALFRAIMDAGQACRPDDIDWVGMLTHGRAALANGKPVE